MTYKEEIRKITEKVVKKFTKDLPAQAGDFSFSVESPNQEEHGDYSSNVALVLSKKIGKNPKETAELLKELIIKDNTFKKVEIAGPGFINFFLKDEIYIEGIKKIDKNYGKNQDLKNKKVIVEYTDPNPFKEFHIGHLMSNSIGESISRIFDFQSAKVKRACYQGDVGLHVAKAVWNLWKQTEGSNKNAIVFNEHNAYSLGQSYFLGDKAYQEDPIAKREIEEINKKIYNIDNSIKYSSNSPEGWYLSGKEYSLKYFETIYKKLGTKFDYYFFESDTGKIGKKIVEEGLKKGIFEKGENRAIIFKGEKYGLHTRVFVNSEGLPTYEAKELALASEKYKKYKYDKSFVITGKEINEYFKVLLCAMEKIYPELAKKTIHIGHGMMRLPEGKMSSRTGNIITAESLIGKVKELVEEKIKDRDLPNKEEVSEKVAIGAIKYSILKQSIGSDIIYDFDKSISFEGDSGPYLQYSYARAKSVLEKAKKEKVKPSLNNTPDLGKLEKTICRFPEVVENSAKDNSPHYLVSYLTELAREFNNYYAKEKIVDKKDEMSSYKVALTEKFSIVMKNGLWLLGIEALEKI